MYIFKAAVVGAGFMGAEIAQVITYAGLPVLIKDIDQKQIDTAEATMRKIYQRRVDKGKLSVEQMSAKLSLAEFTLSYDDFDDVDIVIEGVPEDLAIKKQVFAELDDVCHQDTIFASNTSALSIEALGTATSRPERVVGMHFFSPAHVMKLVEIVRSPKTGQETIDDVEQFTQELRKIPVIVKECPGFLVNRLLMTYLNEAVLALQEGAASIIEIDRAMGQEGFGWPMGPFSLMDMIGNDVCYHVGHYLGSQYGQRMEPAILFEEVYRDKRFGEKAGKGWYDYPGGDKSPRVNELVEKLQQEDKVESGTSFSVERLMMPMLNEAFLCVEEDIANLNDIDMACIAGLGMQVSVNGRLERMGPLAYSDQVGLDVVLEALQDLQARYGRRFKPAEILVEKVEAGELGQKSMRGFLEYAV